MEEKVRSSRSLYATVENKSGMSPHNYGYQTQECCKQTKGPYYQTQECYNQMHGRCNRTNQRQGPTQGRCNQTQGRCNQTRGRCNQTRGRCNQKMNFPHRSVTNLVFLTILLIVQYIPGTYSAWINPADFQETLVTLKDQGLGVQSWQDHLDGLTYDLDIPTGSILVEKLAEAIGKRFDEQIEAINKLKKTIEENYASFSASSSPSQKCCTKSGLTYDANFLTSVDKTAGCELFSESSVPGAKHLGQVTIDAMKENLKKNPKMKWQYFGSKKGVMTIYPANQFVGKCGTFDPRYRPWYVEASSPITKEVVVVIDHSKSMIKPATSPLMAIAKEAAITVLDSISSNDFVGVVGFNNEVTTRKGCFSESMAMASQHNIKQLKEFVEGLEPSGSTSYVKSLQKAFELLQTTENVTANSDEHAQRAKVILFLTDGAPNESPFKIKAEIANLKAIHNESVVIMTYALGKEGISQSSRQLLKDIASESGGKFEHVETPSKLRGSMASYYEIFSTKTSPVNKAVISLPYYDAFGLGIVTTVTVPVHYKSEMIGVLGIDMPVNDLFSDSIFNRHYMFMTDFTGRAWRHPLLPDAREGELVSTNVNIEALERNKESASVVASMKRGDKGNKTFFSHHLISMGDPFRDGVVEQNLNSTYYWDRVPKYNLSICIVMVGGNVEDEITDKSVKDKAKFVYHRADVVEPSSVCSHFQRVSSMQASLKFSPECFVDPSAYLNQKETKETIAAMERYMTYQSATRNPGFMTDIRATAAMTSQADDIWVKRSSTIQKYIIWRYIGTYNGIVRIVPLAQLDKAYNPTLRPWYRRAISQPGKSVFSTPYKDAFGACIVVTLSHTLYLGNKLKNQKPGDSVVGVLGADFTLEYFYKLLGDTFPKCKEKGFSCFIIDNSGYVVIHKDFVEAKNGIGPELEYMHVTVKDSELAKLLINDGYLTNRGCIDIRRMRDQISWKLDLGSKTVREYNSTYEVAAVADSNIFIVVKKDDSTGEPCACSSKSIDSVDEFHCLALGTCQCPCFKETTYKSCEDKLLTDSSSYLTCTPKAPTLNVTSTTKEEQDKAKTLKYCYQDTCSEKTKESECTGVLGCSWCHIDKKGGLLSKPYCGSQAECYLGMEGLSCGPTGLNPPPGGGGPKPPGLSAGVIVGIALGVLLGVSLVVVIVLAVLAKRGVIMIRCPFGSKEEQPIDMSDSHKQGTNGISGPYGHSEVAKHFDPVVLEGEY